MDSSAWIRAIKRRKSLDSYHYFLTQVHHNLIDGWFVQELCRELQQFYADVQAGNSPRLMITAPPRHGKTDTAVRFFVSWCFANNPDIEIIGTSYAATLASSINRDIQTIMIGEKFVDLFGHMLNSKRVVTVDSQPLRNSETFQIIGRRGRYTAAGVGGGITGKGGDIIVVDDPFKDHAEANSSVIRESVWNWYQSTLFTRLSPRSGIVLINTRWHVDDLSGRLLKHEPDRWRLVNFPAIADRDEEHRREGEALCPDRYPLERLLEIKATLGGGYHWLAMFQQTPTFKDGELIKTGDFVRWDVLPEIKYRIITADTANKKGEHNDYTVMQCWGADKNGNAYLIDQVRGRYEIGELESTMLAFWDKHFAQDRFVFGNLRNVYIEDKASGTQLIQMIKAKTNLPIRAVERTKDKVERVNDILGYITAGRVYIPERAEWVSDFLSECQQFSPLMSHLHDDQVDAMADAVLTICTSNNKVDAFIKSAGIK